MLFLIILSSILAIVTGIQDSFLPHTYVVEFEQPVHAFATKRHLLYRRSEFYQQLNDLNINYDIRHEYEIINAISVVFKTLEDSSLFFDKMNGIKKSWPVVNYLYINLLCVKLTSFTQSSISKPQVFHKANSFGDEIGSLFSFYDVTGVLKAREKLG
jgi:hypothetical protein